MTDSSKQPTPQAASSPQAGTKRRGVPGRRTLTLITLTLATAAVVGTLLPASDKPTPIRSDERVVLFPVAAAFDEMTNTWTVPVHGWVFEPEEHSLVRNLTIKAIAKTLGFGDDEDEQELSDDAKQRFRAFLVDNKRGKRIAVKLGSKTYIMPDSQPNGHFNGSISLTRAERSKVPPESKLTPDISALIAITPDGDLQRYTGRVMWVQPEGLAVISDIDDTIKISNVRDKKALMENTFIKPFAPAPGMADLYGKLADQDAAFFYVSSSPWQLYEPLHAFMQAEHFPPGEMHLKLFRVKDRSFLDLFADPMETKPPLIEGILTRFPKRKFILVGDSGEHDPEVYGLIARAHPDQITRILIRNVTDEAPDAQRFQDAFQDVDAAKWQVFKDAADVTLPTK
ncbi:MAG: DUF2183 domain-containing protein [Phycisphaera sp.]|nr:DUF2183 domain-containing protein [Phycisphaera sp.]